MKQIPVSKFKAICLAVLREVRETGEPVQITRFGRPVAELSRPRASSSARRRQPGRLAGTLVIRGDIVAPIGDESDWDALR